MELTQ